MSLAQLRSLPSPLMSPCEAQRELHAFRAPLLVLHLRSSVDVRRAQLARGFKPPAAQGPPPVSSSPPGLPGDFKSHSAG